MNKQELHDQLFHELDAVFYEKLPACKTREQKLELIQQKFLVGGTLFKILSRLDCEESEELQV